MSMVERASSRGCEGGSSSSSRTRRHDANSPGDRGDEAPQMGCMGTLVCASLAAVPAALPLYACLQRRRIVHQYPIDSEARLVGDVSACCCAPCSLFQVLGFLLEQHRAGLLRYPGQDNRLLDTSGLSPPPKFKVVFLGMHKAGKSALFNQAARRPYVTEYHSDAQASLAARMIFIPHQPPACIELWDIPAASAVDLRGRWIGGADAAVIVVDPGDRASFRAARSWLEELDYVCLPAGSSSNQLLQPAGGTLEGAVPTTLGSAELASGENTSASFLRMWGAGDGVSSLPPPPLLPPPLELEDGGPPGETDGGGRKPARRRRRVATAARSIAVFVVLTKADLKPPERCGFLADLSQWAEDKGCVLAAGVSGRTGEGVQRLMRAVTAACFQRRQQQQQYYHHQQHRRSGHRAD